MKERSAGVCGVSREIATSSPEKEAIQCAVVVPHAGAIPFPYKGGKLTYIFYVCLKNESDAVHIFFRLLTFS